MDPVKKFPAGKPLDRGEVLGKLFRSLTASASDEARFVSLRETFFRKRMDQKIVSLGLRNWTSKY